MIIEGLLTTVRDDGSAHVAPMGPIVDPLLRRWTLRPFQTSTTFSLLRANPVCIFHTMDDVVPVVQAALGLPTQLSMTEHEDGGWIIDSACRYFRLQIVNWDVSLPRSEAQAEVTSSGTQHDFWGWNRAKHAIIEATILATRVEMLEADEIAADLQRLAIAVKKTAGPRELEAWQLLLGFFAGHNI